MEDTIICKSCGYVIDLLKVPEECMGYTRCPRCKSLVNNEGNPTKNNKFFTNFFKHYYNLD